MACLLVAGVTGLILALGLAERRRTFALLAALGAKSHQVGAFLWGEGVVIQVSGGIIGIVLGFGIAQMLVTILTGVFDPPLEALSIPWIYLVLMAAASIVSMIVAVLGMQVASRRPAVEALPGQSHLVWGIGSTSHVITSSFLKLCCIDALYRPLENLDAIALEALRDL